MRYQSVSTHKRLHGQRARVLPFRDVLFTRTKATNTFMRLASILNCSEPVLGGAQNKSDCSTFTIVSDSRSHWLLHHPDHSSIAVVAGSRHRNGGQRLHYVVTTDAIT